MADEQYEKFMVEIAKIHQRMTDHYGEEEKFKTEMRKKLDPMYDIFVNAKGFGDIAVTILKAVILVGAGIGVLIGFLKWLKN